MMGAGQLQGAKTAGSGKKTLSLLIKIGITIGIFLVLLAKIDLDAVMVRIAKQDLSLFFLALAVLALHLLIHAWRWKTILETIRSPLPLPRVLRFLSIALFFNQALPTGVGGDAVRIWITNKFGTGISAATNSVMLDRLCHMVGLMLVVALTQPLLAGMVKVDELEWGLPLIILATLGGLAALMTLDRTPKDWQRWRPVRAVAYLAADIRRIFLRPPALAKQVFLSLLGHGAMIVSYMVLAKGMSIAIEPLTLLALLPPVMLIAALPISLNGWGVREAAMIGMLAFAGVPAADALSLSLVQGVSVLITRLPGGVVWLLTRVTA